MHSFFFGGCGTGMVMVDNMMLIMYNMMVHWRQLELMKMTITFRWKLNIQEFSNIHIPG